MRSTPSRTLFESQLVSIGTFSIDVEHPEFGSAGQIREPEFVFPRTAVWIEHDGRPRFLADPTIVTLYNGGTAYQRHALSRDGDRCDWFRVEPRTLREIAGRFDARAASRAGVFDRPWRRASPRCYARQRLLLRRLRSGEIDALEVEAEVVDLLHEILGPDLERATAPADGRVPETARDGVVDACRAVLLAPDRRWTLAELGERSGLTPFQLVRAFKRWAGSPVHAWVLDLRLRLSLERVAGGEELSTVALDLGFASHSHFTTAFGTAFGVTPSQFRARARLST